MPFAGCSTRTNLFFRKEPYTMLLPSDDQIGDRLPGSNVNRVEVLRVRSNVQILPPRTKARVLWSGEIRGTPPRPGSPTVLMEWPSRLTQVSWLGALEPRQSARSPSAEADH